jgi:hypothetical protein
MAPSRKKKTPANSDPFFLGEIIINNPDTKTFEMQWWKPTAESRKRSAEYKHLCFAAELDKMRIKNKDGKPAFKLIPYLEKTMSYTSIHFGFTRLLPSGELPSEVLRKLKSLSLVSGSFKRSV